MLPTGSAALKSKKPGEAELDRDWAFKRPFLFLILLLSVSVEVRKSISQSKPKVKLNVAMIGFV